MSLYKQVKDHVVKWLFGSNVVSRGLVELCRYFRSHDPIRFRYEQQQDGSYIAISDNFRHGSIITHTNTLEELDGQIRDAILTAFSIPSSCAKEAELHRKGEGGYIFA